MQSEPWALFWRELQLIYKHFEEIGLAHDVSDLLLWQACQREQLILITDNRNLDSSDSLESTIREHTKAESLPVLTIASIPRLLESRDYVEHVIERIFEILLDIDAMRGTGRLYIP